MHELSLAEELAARCAELAGARRVVAVKLRCGAGVDQEELAAAFALVAASPLVPALMGAALEVEGAAPTLSCQCGYSGQLGAEQVAGHVGVCPGCGRPAELDGGVELVSVRLAGGAEEP